jgi:hypothetical protein
MYCLGLKIKKEMIARFTDRTVNLALSKMTQTKQSLRFRLFRGNVRLDSYEDVKNELIEYAKDKDKSNAGVYISITEKGNEKSINVSIGNRTAGTQIDLNPQNAEQALKYIAGQKGDTSLVGFGSSSTGTVLTKKNCEDIIKQIITLRSVFLRTDTKTQNVAEIEAENELRNYLLEKSGGVKKFSSETLTELLAASEGITKSQAGSPERWKDRLAILKDLKLKKRGSALKTLGYDTDKIFDECLSYFMVRSKRFASEEGNDTKDQYTVSKYEKGPGYTNGRVYEKFEEAESGLYVDKREPKRTEKSTSLIKLTGGAVTRGPRELTPEEKALKEFLVSKVGEDSLAKVPKNTWPMMAKSLRESDQKASRGH